VAVEDLAGPVITHRRSRIRMAGSDLDVPEPDASIEHGRGERMPEHVPVRPGDWHPGGFCEPLQAPRCGVRVHAAATAAEQYRPTGTAAVALSIARPTAGGIGTKTAFVYLPHTRSTRWPCSSPRSAMSALVASKIRNPSSPSIAMSAKSQGDDDSRAVRRPEAVGRGSAKFIMT